jgi:hypothetical protein
MWHDVIFLNFSNYFSNEKVDVACYLNFKKLFLMEKEDIT